MKSKVYTVTIPVTLFVTAPKEMPDATKDDHARADVAVRAKRCVAHAMEVRDDKVFADVPPNDWEVSVRIVENAQNIKRFLP
jgi:hypothetical protein